MAASDGSSLRHGFGGVLSFFIVVLIGVLAFSIRLFSVFTTHHWMVRIYKLKPQRNRIRVKSKKAKSKPASALSSNVNAKTKNPWQYTVQHSYR